MLWSQLTANWPSRSPVKSPERVPVPSRLSASSGGTNPRIPISRSHRTPGRNVVLWSRLLPFFACRTNVRPRCNRERPGPVLPRYALRPSALTVPVSNSARNRLDPRSILDPGTLPGYTLFHERAGAVTQEPGLQADESAAFHRAGAGGEQAPLGGGDLRPGKGGVPGSGTLHGVPDAGPVARAWDRAQGGLRRGIFALRARDRADAPPRTLRRVRRGYRVQRRANGVP